jgi:hypothetical protein
MWDIGGVWVSCDWILGSVFALMAKMWRIGGGCWLLFERLD